MISKAIVAIALISVLSNPVFNIDSAAITYKMTLSAASFPLSLSYTVYDRITISPGGVATIVTDTGDIPIDWVTDITEDVRPMFILTTAEIAAKSCMIDGDTFTMTEGKETGFVPYYGASILISDDVQNGDFGSIKWNEATGILLSMHAEQDVEGELVNIDVEYVSSDVDIYSDQSALEKGWNQFITSLMTPLGVVLLAAIVAIVAVAVVLCVALKVPKKVKRAVRRH
jgi:hypothetical protein